ncbi:hypothetical protein [Paludisphaera soli]|uniref:hypothetical protein n=1 Tax=Paludisphaera soli TaxID=2712865 RepID=UPI0013E9E2CE|nr:hypothetical protein [Paludisphaera soli]
MQDASDLPDATAWKAAPTPAPGASLGSPREPERGPGHRSRRAAAHAWSIDYLAGQGIELHATRPESKLPAQAGWASAGRDPAELRDVLRVFPELGLAGRLGPYRDRWLIEVEVDGPGGRESAEGLLGPLRTACWLSSRGPHWLAWVPELHARLLRPVKNHPAFPGLEVRIGGWNARLGRPKGVQFCVPPTATGGFARTWVDASPVAWLPDAALVRLLGFSAAQTRSAGERAVGVAAREGGAAYGHDAGGRGVDFEAAEEVDEDDAEWIEYRRGRVLEDFARIGPAISGAGGHDATFAAACAVVEAGVPEDDQMEFLEAYNLDCDPEWSAQELEHKLEDARIRVGDVRRKRDRLWRAFASRKGRPRTGL